MPLIFSGVSVIAIGLIPMLGFYTTPHEPGIASDYWANISLAPFTLLLVGLGSILGFIGLVRFLLSFVPK